MLPTGSSDVAGQLQARAILSRIADVPEIQEARGSNPLALARMQRDQLLQILLSSPGSLAILTAMRQALFFAGKHSPAAVG
jgi:hypothetical protein